MEYALLARYNYQCRANLIDVHNKWCHFSGGKSCVSYMGPIIAITIYPIRPWKHRGRNLRTFQRRSSETLVNFYQTTWHQNLENCQSDRNLATFQMSFSETLVNFYQTTRCYKPEDSHPDNRRNYWLSLIWTFM
jgi:hypothetical protein